MERKDIAWNNAPEWSDTNPNQERMCYICETTMNYGDRWDPERYPDRNQETAWDIDHIDGNDTNNNTNNLVATHRMCNLKKGNQNYTQKYKNCFK